MVSESGKQIPLDPETYDPHTCSVDEEDDDDEWALEKKTTTAAIF